MGYTGWWRQKQWRSSGEIKAKLGLHLTVILNKFVARLEGAPKIQKAFFTLISILLLVLKIIF